MTDKEIILLFKRDMSMSEKQWKVFCKRYATREIFTVINFIKELYSDTDITISKTFGTALRNEMKRSLQNANYSNL